MKSSCEGLRRHSSTANQPGLREASLSVVALSLCSLLSCVSLYLSRVFSESGVELRRARSFKDDLRGPFFHDLSGFKRDIHFDRRHSGNHSLLSQRRLHQLFPKLNHSQWNFTDCEWDSGWPSIRKSIFHGRDLCIPMKSHGSDHQSAFPSSQMTCWNSKRSEQSEPYLCFIRNLYAELNPQRGSEVIYRLHGCDTMNESMNESDMMKNGHVSSSFIRLYNEKMRGYESFPIEVGGLDTLMHNNNHDNQSSITLPESLAITFYGMVENVWHAIADVNAHWQSMYLLSELLMPLEKEYPKYNTMLDDWTVVKYKGDYIHKSKIEPFYRRLWDRVIFEHTPGEYIRTRVEELWNGWDSSGNESILVRLPQIIFPLPHWSGLHWNKHRHCPKNQPNRNPVFLQWKSIVDGWMRDIINSHGSTLLTEMCNHKQRKHFRMFDRVSDSNLNAQRSHVDGWRHNYSDCRDFWRKALILGDDTDWKETLPRRTDGEPGGPPRQSRIMFFGERYRHRNGREECATHRCIRNVNETRDALIHRFGDRYSIVMGNPGELSLQSQFELFQRTDVLIGMHGAMFALSQFLRTGSLVFEILPVYGYSESSMMVLSLAMDYASFQLYRSQSWRLRTWPVPVGKLMKEVEVAVRRHESLSQRRWKEGRAGWNPVGWNLTTQVRHKIIKHRTKKGKGFWNKNRKNEIK